MKHKAIDLLISTGISVLSFIDGCFKKPVKSCKYYIEVNSTVGLRTWAILINTRTNCCYRIEDFKNNILDITIIGRAMFDCEKDDVLVILSNEYIPNNIMRCSYTEYIVKDAYRKLL